MLGKSLVQPSYLGITTGPPDRFRVWLSASEDQRRAFRGNALESILIPAGVEVGGLGICERAVELYRHEMEIGRTRIADLVAGGIKASGKNFWLFIGGVDDERPTIDSTSIKVHRQAVRAVEGNQSELSRGGSTPRGPWPWMRGRPIRVVVRCHRRWSPKLKSFYSLLKPNTCLQIRVLTAISIKQVLNQIVRPVVPRYHSKDTIADGPQAEKLDIKPNTCLQIRVLTAISIKQAVDQSMGPVLFLREKKRNPEVLR